MKLFIATFAGFILINLVSFISASTQYDRIEIFVNDHVITRNEIDLRVIETARQRKVGSDNAELMATLRIEVIDSLISETLLDIRADELKIQLSSDQLEEELIRLENNVN